MTDVRIPEGLGPVRRRILEVALGELGVREERPNDGKRVKVYRPSWAKPAPWCAWFVGWVVHQATGRYLPGGHIGSCMGLLRAAQRADVARVPRTDAILPGDVFVLDTDGAKGGKGHVGFVLRVSPDYRVVNTVEGNCGNAVRLGVRSLDNPGLVGAICTVPDDLAIDLVYGTIEAEDVAKDGTR